MILFLSSPTLSILSYLPYSQPNIGATQVAGDLIGAGKKLIYIDNNSALNKYRYDSKDFEFLNYEEFKCLSSISGLEDGVFGIGVSERLNNWFDTLIDHNLSYIQNESEIESVCVSLEKAKNLYYSTCISFNFLILYLNRLKIRLGREDLPFYVGGNLTFNMLNIINYMKDVVDVIHPSMLPTRFIDGVSKEKFPSYYDTFLVSDISLLKSKDFKKLKDIKLSSIYKTEGKKQYTVSAHPNLLVANHSDGDLQVDKFWDKNLLKRYPEINNVQPFNYYSYRFSEGCIFKCSFCGSGLYDGFKRYSLEDTVDFFSSLQDNGIKYVRFMNDNFNFKISWVNDFCNAIVKKNIKIKWSDSANTRVGDEDMFRAMSEAGCIKLWYGLESVSKRILKMVRKEVDLERILQVLEWSSKHNIWNCGNFIIGVPHETEEEFQELISFIKTNYSSGLLNGFEVNAYRLLPATEMKEYPDRFNIRLLGTDEVRRGFMWEEINGLTWNEITQRGEDRLNRLFIETGIDSSITSLSSNDYFFFGLYEAYNNFQKISEITNHIVDNKKKYADFIIKKINYDETYYSNMISQYENKCFNDIQMKHVFKR